MYKSPYNFWIWFLNLIFSSSNSFTLVFKVLIRTSSERELFLGFDITFSVFCCFRRDSILCLISCSLYSHDLETLASFATVLQLIVLPSSDSLEITLS